MERTATGHPGTEAQALRIAATAGRGGLIHGRRLDLARRHRRPHGRGVRADAPRDASAAALKGLGNGPGASEARGAPRRLASSGIEAAVLALALAQRREVLDADDLDGIAIAFAQVIDAKSPYTHGASDRVALFADLIAGELGVPTEARIIAAADVIDALTAGRPYRGPRPADEAFALMDSDAGSALDPACIAALERALAPA